MESLLRPGTGKFAQFFYFLVEFDRKFQVFPTKHMNFDKKTGNFRSNSTKKPKDWANFAVQGLKSDCLSLTHILIKFHRSQCTQTRFLTNNCCSISKWNLPIFEKYLLSVKFKKMVISKNFFV